MHRPLSLRSVCISSVIWAVSQACNPAPPVPAPPEIAQRALALAQQGQLERAEAELDTAITAQPNAIELHLVRGAVIERTGRLDEARLAYLDAQQLDPSHPNPPLHLERIAKMQSLDTQIAVARDNLRNATHPGAAHLALADLLADRFLANPAQRQYALALLYDPNNARAHAGMALALIGVRRQVLGLYHASEALRLAPDNARALGEMVWVLATSSDGSLRDPEEAIRLALTSQSRTPRLLDGLAAAYAQLGRHDQAIATADLAIAASAQERTHTLTRAIQARRARYAAGHNFVGPPIDPT